jgi:sporulation protein YlmC with PRC-barrel domain
MGQQEVQIQSLLNRRVIALNGRRIGRLEEIRIERRGEDYVVSEYLVGTFAMFERLAALSIGRAVLKVLRLTCKGRGYRVRWDQLDIRDPSHPKLLCTVDNLASLAD